MRLVEPTSPELVRRRLGVTHYGLYASAEYLARAPALAEGLEGQTIVAPGGELSRSPEGRFLAEHGRRARVALRCSSLVALAAAAEASVGLVALPTNLALFHPALRLVRALDEIPVRAVWLVMHRDAAKDARVRRAAKVVGQVVTAALDESAPAAIAACPARSRTARRARSS